MKSERARLITILALTASMLAIVFACTPSRKHTKLPAQDDTLESNLESIRSRNGVPALAAFTVTSTNIVEMAAVGVRVAGHPEAVTIHDQWHLGSITKPMTVTLAALLVERGVISWKTTIREVYPQLSNSMRPEYLQVTLEDLLRHESGLSRNVPGAWLTNIDRTTPLVDQRRACVALFVKSKPEVPRGTYLYSNSGFILAGAMLEERMGIGWERLIRKELFDPLEMHNTGFGPPGTGRDHTQPWGHLNTPHILGNRLESFSPESPRADNPPTFGPCGTVHATLDDIARFAMSELASARGEKSLLSTECSRKLHTPDTSGSAIGWGINERDWSGGRIYTHTGSNTKWFAEIQVAPSRNAAFFAVCNAGGPASEKAVAQALDLLHKRLKQ